MATLARNISLFVISILLPLSLHAQGAEDVLRHSLEYPSYDAQTMIMPGSAYNSGFGSFQDNPAVMGLTQLNYASFGLSMRNVEEETSFHGSQFTFDDSQTNIGDFGLVYSLPTVQGKFVFGGGYSQTTDYNRAMGINYYNEQSTLTDEYNNLEQSFPSLYDAAFNAYALDWADADSTFTESIFRIGFAPEDFLGVKQNMELTERGRMGEYSAFFATEFQKRLFIGASIGVNVGEYHYRREFLESDSENYYDSNTLIDSDSDGNPDTDIESILSIDTIDSRFTAFTARIGLLYQINSFLNIGASYEIPSTLSFSENYNTSISSTFDNGEGFEEEVPGEFEYKVLRPTRYSVGVAIDDLNGLSLSAAVERVDYGTAELDLEGSDLAYQQQENQFISQNFNSTTNLRAGLEYAFNEAFITRVGYAWYESPRQGFDTTRQFYSAGLSAQISEGIWFDFGAQYSTWNDQNQLYTYSVGNISGAEIVSEDVKRLHFMAGLRIGLN